LAAKESIQGISHFVAVDDAPTQIEKALTSALTADRQPFRQFWHVLGPMAVNGFDPR
jgi:predicted N-acetyltransferase YhbS